ncbi:GFA family protein [Chitinimonas naiadis]
MKYLGSCHCGRIKFEVEGEIESATSCNCSMCQRKGTLMWFVPRSALRLLTPEENLSTYLFNKHKIQHRFCANCGIHPYGEAAAPNGEEMAAVNLRCIEDIDPTAFPVHHYDGRAL